MERFSAIGFMTSALKKLYTGLGVMDTKMKQHFEHNIIAVAHDSSNRRIIKLGFRVKLSIL